ncbi:MAG: YbhB/YbcL family Raf kinase inhibitor-like protein [Eubacteriales bacterium]|nr:YbhB/YbcL family Raf kinase inhibitor-like protein [Eubacteriales bacterium]MDD3881048.1 YbhB/YbcL family Raf kinase inhibitor-like protein [Eubacteriales bacterium]MDD4511883.1 YbhB/YbcL family Raf kinase inhibitor-like protein [Eubacteriales bacterium]
MDKLEISSPAFQNEGQIPIKHTGFGEDLSPELYIGNLSGDAVSLAVVMEDLDVPFLKSFPHWVIWNIPPLDAIPEGVPAGKKVDSLGGAVQGAAFGKNCYRGPKQPPFIKSAHRYMFSVYALDIKLSLPPTAGKDGLMRAMLSHIIQEGSITGVYKP